MINICTIFPSVYKSGQKDSFYGSFYLLIKIPMVADENRFEASIHAPKALSAVLSVLSFKTIALCVITADGLSLSVQDSKAMQASVFLPAPWFENYRLNGPIAPFSFDIKVLDSCLSLVGKDQDAPMLDIQSQTAHSSIKLSYPSQGGELQLLY